MNCMNNNRNSFSMNNGNQTNRDCSANCRNTNSNSGSTFNSNGNFKYLNYVCSVNNVSAFENMPKCQLMEHLQIISFAIDDLRLFIDTHPNCSDAIECINELMQIRHLILKLYTTKFGPIYSYFVDTDDGWDWNSSPLPWTKAFL